MRLAPEEVAETKKAAEHAIEHGQPIDWSIVRLPKYVISDLIADLEEVTARAEAAGNMSEYNATCRESLREELAATRKQLAEAQAKLAHLAEYWNRDENEIAMKDACWHTVEVAEASDTSALDAAIAEAVDPYRKDAACWQFVRKELCWREEGKKQIRWTMILRMPKPNIGIEVLREGSVAKELDAAVLAAIAAKGETE